MVQTKREIRSLLSGAGIEWPAKRLGQHFLIDLNLMHKLVAAAEIGQRDVVLEVGPGTGSLTEELVARAGHVVAVEMDRRLHEICRSRFAACDHITLIAGDVLERKSVIAEGVLRALGDRHAALGGRVMLVANLPYQVATPLVMDLLLGDPPVSPLCFTVQAEVADRLVASPGGKVYGQISVLTQALATTRQIADVPPEAFWPRPKVHSTMLRVDVDRQQRMPPAVLTCVRALLNGCFQHRRKTMNSNLRVLLDKSTFQRVLDAGRWDLSRRPEQITVAEWVELARLVSAGGWGP